MAVIETPTLDWFYEGHTLEWKITNATDEMILNATIVDIDDEDNAVIEYWSVLNGTNESLATRYQNKNRSDLNLTDFYTYMWVNGSNVDGGVLEEVIKIGSSDYTLTAITTEYYVFENETRTYKYDLEHGYLAQAIYPDSEVNLCCARTDVIPETLDSNPCHDVDGDGKKDGDYGSDSELTTEATAFVCLEDIGGGGTCWVEWQGRSHIRWPTWHLFTYSYKIWKDGEIIAEDPDWNPDITIPPHATEIRPEVPEAVPLDPGENLSTAARTTNWDSQTHTYGFLDQASASAEWTCPQS